MSDETQNVTKKHLVAFNPDFKSLLSPFLVSGQWAAVRKAMKPDAGRMSATLTPVTKNYSFSCGVRELSSFHFENLVSRVECHSPIASTECAGHRP